MPRVSRTSRMVSAMLAVSVSFMPAAGSSSISSRGSVASARATSTRFWSPYDRCATALQVVGEPEERTDLDPLAVPGLLGAHAGRAAPP